jgi:hypothetical protein
MRARLEGHVSDGAARNCEQPRVRPQPRRVSGGLAAGHHALDVLGGAGRVVVRDEGKPDRAGCEVQREGPAVLGLCAVCGVISLQAALLYMDTP